MDGKFLIRCVLIQVLLITVYGENTKILITCQNTAGIEGQQLNLICTVECGECNYANHYIRHNENNSTFECSREPVQDIKNHKKYEFHCIIPSANGKFTFWVQMTTGTNQTTFYVTKKAQTTQTTDLPTKPTPEKMIKPEDNRPSVAALVVVVMFVLAIGIMVTVLFRRKQHYIMSNSAQSTSQSNAEAEII